MTFTLHGPRATLHESLYLIPHPSWPRAGRGAARLPARNDRRRRRFRYGGNRAGHLEMDFQALGGKAASHAIGPFDQHQSVRLEILLRTKIEKLLLAAHAISIEVVDRPMALVLVDQHEGGTDDVEARNASGLGNGLDQARLARAERAAQGHRGARRQDLGQGSPQGDRGRLVVGLVDQRCHADRGP